MKLLLDTHILLWSFFESDELSGPARDLLLDPENTPYASVVSLWEIALKEQAHPGSMIISEDMAADLCDDAGFGRWNITSKHVLSLSGLSRRDDTPLHKDPFDRLLLAQAKAEDAVLVTHDRRLSEYENVIVILV